jgi:hypothetical protein
LITDHHLSENSDTNPATLALIGVALISLSLLNRAKRKI